MTRRKQMPLTEAVERLIPKTRGRGRLDPAAERDGIKESIGITYPSASQPGSGGGGVASPLTEQPYTGTTYYDFVSSDGLFVFEYPTETDYLDGNNDEVTVVHLNQ